MGKLPGEQGMHSIQGVNAQIHEFQMLNHDVCICVATKGASA